MSMMNTVKFEPFRISKENEKKCDYCGQHLHIAFREISGVQVPQCAYCGALQKIQRTPNVTYSGRPIYTVGKSEPIAYLSNCKITHIS